MWRAFNTMNFSFSHVAIESIAHILPPIVVTSDEIEQRLGALYERLHLPFGRLELMTGIRERRMWHGATPSSQASTKAARNVLERTSIPSNAIDLLIHTSVCRDRLEPATAAYVHHNLQLSNHTLFFDLSNACLGFLNAMTMVASMIEARQIRSALIVSGENGKPLLDHTLALLQNNTTITRKTIKSYFANLTIGSGAVAALLCHESLIENQMKILKIKAVSALSDSSGCTLCQGDMTTDNGLTMQTDSEALLKCGIQLAQNNWQQFLNYTQLSNKNIAHTICHQVGQRHRSLLYQALELDLEKDFSTFPFLGNTGSVALPLTLSLATEKNIIHGQTALLGIGSGISSLMMLLEIISKI
ncbi:MAG: 3-oxoacyl-ACP synthase III [Puniceicoccales bacterium]|jgi:3-oxoacyl-[acyl-carrier-protein] synthase-3|nr:3-oxoacyl-ACP synthase III [Puniceicoccales bacterium]